MTEAYQKNPSGQIPYGYKQLAASGPSGTALGPTLIYALIGMSLGIVAGTEFAARTWRPITPVTPPHVVLISSKTAGLNPHPVTYAVQNPNAVQNPEAGQHPNAAQNPKLERQADNKGNEQLRPAPRAGAGEKPAAHRVSALHRHRLARRLAGWKKSFARRKVSLRHRPRFFLYAPAAASLPPAFQQVRLDDAAELFSFTIEGEVTETNYDASERTIRTYEGKTFVIDMTVGETDAIPWQDYRANVHYRCNQAGDCTLTRAGVVAPNAKMTT